MRKILLVSLSCVMLSIFGLRAYSEEMDEIINKHIKAIGGIEKLNEIKSIKMEGKAHMQEIEAPIVMIIKRPNYIREEITIQGRTMIQAYDGQIGWRIIPFTGKAEAEKMPERELELIKERADLEGPLVNYKNKGIKVELLGKEDVQGTEAYKFKITLKNEKIRYIYIDTEEYLILKQTTKEKIENNEIEIDSYLSNYKPVEGLIFPHSIEVKVKDATVQQIIIEKIELNPQIDDAIFKMP